MKMRESDIDAEIGESGKQVKDLNKASTVDADDGQHAEGPIARTIEQQTAKLPSDLFLWAALGAMGVSLGCHIAGKNEESRLFGQWAAPFLLFGVYNKVVKLHGSDGDTRSNQGKERGSNLLGGLTHKTGDAAI